MTLDNCHAVFKKWFGKEYDLDVVDATLCAAMSERLDGDPLWLLVVAGSGNAKTETISTLSTVGAHIISTISSDAALLSGTPRRDRTEAATGGLLRKIGPRGLLVIKDVTSVLSTSREIRGAILSALREIYDGRWGRDIGGEGGQSLVWQGRLVVVGAVTTAWDQAHSVIATMGDRFALIRPDSTNGRSAARRKAISNTGSEMVMRAELGSAVANALANVDLTRDLTLTDDEAERIGAAADLVTLARTAVIIDYQGNVLDARAPEMPTRFAKQLAQVIRAGIALGMARADGLQLAIRIARDSMPPLRLGIIDDIAAHPHSTASETRRRIDKPRNTVDRQCQALHMLGVLTCDEVIYGEQGRVRWHYSLADGIEPHTLKSVPDKSVHTPKPLEESASEGNAPIGVTDKVGTLDRECAFGGHRFTPMHEYQLYCPACAAMLDANPPDDEEEYA
jgi:hypothetical protein